MKINIGERIENLLADLFRGTATEASFVQLEILLLERVKILSQRLAILNEIATIDSEGMKFTKKEMDFMQKPFPVILICNNEEKISLCDFSTQEYRACEPLKFGEDITAIATDTQEHQLLIIKYLETNNARNVAVILIDQLHTSKIDNKPPRSSFTHNDGFQRLSFLAAKNVPHSVTPEDQKAKETIDAARQYTNIELF